MITENLSTLKINKLTQAQYDAAAKAGTINENEIYMTPDDNELDTTQFLRVSDENSAVDPVPIDADTLEGKSASDFMLATKETSLVKSADIVDSLTSTDTTKPLSANQGRVLKSSVDAKAPLASPTFTGTPKASTNTSYTTAQLRNVILSTADPTSSDGNNGDIWIKYTN